MSIVSRPFQIKTMHLERDNLSQVGWPSRVRTMAVQALLSPFGEYGLVKNDASRAAKFTCFSFLQLS